MSGVCGGIGVQDRIAIAAEKRHDLGASTGSGTRNESVDLE